MGRKSNAVVAFVRRGRRATRDGFAVPWRRRAVRRPSTLAARVDGERAPLPASMPAASGRERVLTTLDSQFAPVDMHLRTIYRDGWLCTVYEPSALDQGGAWPLYWAPCGRGSAISRYDGTEGELYNCREDPHQFRNRCGGPAVRRWRDELIADLRAHLPPARTPPLGIDSPT